MAEDVEVMSVNKEAEEEQVTPGHVTPGRSASPGQTVSSGLDTPSSNLASQSNQNNVSNGIHAFLFKLNAYIFFLQQNQN